MNKLIVILGPTASGKTSLAVKLADSLNGESVYRLTTSVKTNSFLDAFYEVRDEIQSWLNIENLSLRKTLNLVKLGCSDGLIKLFKAITLGKLISNEGLLIFLL